MIIFWFIIYNKSIMLHIVLFEPEIPQNTGNIARTCIAFNARLHLIRPYGFVLNDKKLIRSGVDYWNKLDLVEHDSYEDFIKQTKNDSKIYYVTRYGKLKPNESKYNIKNDVYLVFGKESTGIDKNILLNNINNTIRIPSSKNVRSLNLSNCVALMCYEVLRQNNYVDLELSEPHKELIKGK